MSESAFKRGSKEAPVLDRPTPLRRLHDSGAGYKYSDLLTYFLDLHLSYTHRTQRPPTVTSSSEAGGHYDGLPTAMCNMLRNIQTEATLTSLPGPPKHTLILLR